MTDLDFLGLVPGGDGRFELVVEQRLCRLDGRLYGGTALAASVTAAEMLTERRAFWMTTQFVAGAPAGAHLALHAEILAEGGRTCQVRVTATDEDGQVIFASLGATCHPRPEGLTGTFEEMPEVDGPEGAFAWDNPFVGMARAIGLDVPDIEMPSGVGFHRITEYRQPVLRRHPAPGPGRLCLWVHRRDGVPLSRALVAFVADMVPLGIAQGSSVVASGISLDNTVRYGIGDPTEWVLVDLRPHQVAGGYGHGDALIWNEHGELVAVASQTASMLPFDTSHLPRLRSR